MTDQQLTVDPETNDAMAEPQHVSGEHRRHIVERDAHGAAPGIAVGVIMRGRIARRRSCVVQLTVMIAVMLLLMTGFGLFCNDMVDIRGLAISQHRCNTPVENEGNRKKANDKTA